MPFCLQFFLGGYLHTYDLALCVRKGHQAICTDFTQKYMFLHAKMFSQKFKSRFKILQSMHLVSIILFLHLYKAFFFFPQLFPTVSRMQIQHWLFLSGLKYFKHEFFAFKVVIFVLKTLKMPRKAELLVICFHPHTLVTFHFQKVTLIQPLLIEEQAISSVIFITCYLWIRGLDNPL